MAIVSVDFDNIVPPKVIGENQERGNIITTMSNRARNKRGQTIRQVVNKSTD